MGLAVACFFCALAYPSSAQDRQGCEGVQYSKRPLAEYSRQRLEQRIQQNPSDVDALINLGIRLEEAAQNAQALALYERAIQARPNCALGHLFGGLVQEKISDDAASDADVKIHRAIILDSSLQKDPNVEGYLKRHTRPTPSAVTLDEEPPTLAKQILSGASRFYVGIGVGVVLTSLLLSLLKFRRTSPTGT